MSFLLQYERKCYTTILSRVTIWTIVFVYQIQRNQGSLPYIFSLSQFVHQIEDELWANWVPKQENNYVQKCPENMGSLSLTIIFGLPCSFWTISMNAVTTILDLKGWESAKKCAYLVSLSTITMMTLFPSDFGNPMMNPWKPPPNTDLEWLMVVNNLGS